MLKVLKALMNRLRERFALPKSRLKGSICSVRLSLEEFEPRVTPTTFIWTNVTSNGLWTDPANWLGEAGAPRGSYPGWNGNARTTTDIAEFWGPNPVPTNTPATLNQAVDLGELRVLGLHTASITLTAPLTLHEGGFMRNGVIINSTANASGPITLAGGTFRWNGGDINFQTGVTTTAGAFTVRDGAALEFGNHSQGGRFGDSLTISEGGQVDVVNNNDPITFVNGSSINNDGGTIAVSVDNGIGMGPGAGQTSLAILNNGLMEKTAGPASYIFLNTYLTNAPAGTLRLTSGSLQFPGADPDGFSVTSAGLITVRAGTVLGVPHGLHQVCGSISAPDGNVATIRGNVVIDAGGVSLESPRTILDVSEGSLALNQAALAFVVDGNAARPPLTPFGRAGRIQTIAHNITLNREHVSIDVTFLGPQREQTPPLLSAIRGTINATPIAALLPAPYVGQLRLLDIAQPRLAELYLVRPELIPPPRMQLRDAGGAFNGSAFPATVTVAGVIPGVDDTPADSLEGVTPTLTYYDAAGNPLSGAPSQAGTYSVVASFAGSTDYASADTDPLTFTISPATPTISVSPNGGTFNGSPFGVKATVAGVVAGVDDTPAASLEGVTPALTYYDAAGNALSGAPSDPGTYTVVADFPGSTDYSSATANATFTISDTQATPAVAISDAGGTFTGSAFAATATVAGVVAGVDDTPAASLQGVTPTLAYFDAAGNALSGVPSQAGMYTAVASFTGSTDYTSASASATFVIRQATPTLSLTASGGSFNGSAFAATVTVAGVVAGVDDSPAASLEGVAPTLAYFDAAGNALSGAPSQAGSYSVVASFDGSTDYATASALATFTISRATPTLSLGATGGTFNGSSYVATVSIAGVVSGVDNTPADSLEGVTPWLTYFDASGNRLSDAPSQAGTYTVIAFFGGSIDYARIKSQPLAFTISQATPSVSVSAAGGTFNGFRFDAPATVAGVVAGVDDTPADSLEGIMPTLTYYDAAGEALSDAPFQPGTYTVVAAFAGSTDYASAASEAVTFTISKATPTLSLKDDGGIFNGSAFAATATVAGIVTGVDDTPADSLEGINLKLTYYAGSSASGDPLSGAPTEPGTYTVVAAFAGSTDYASASVSKTFTIAKAKPILTLKDEGGTFTGLPFPATATIAGVLYGVDDTPSGSLEGVSLVLTYYAGTSATGDPLEGAPSDPGTYTVRASFAGSTHYDSAFADVTFTIDS